MKNRSKHPPMFTGRNLQADHNIAKNPTLWKTFWNLCTSIMDERKIGTLQKNCGFLCVWVLHHSDDSRYEVVGFVFFDRHFIQHFFPVFGLKVMGVCPRIFCGLPLDLSPFPKNGYVGSFESKGRHYSS